MVFFGLRSVTATALSLWLGVLACLLGCAKPAGAAPQQHSSSGKQLMNCPEGGGDAGDSCCQHGHDGAGKNSHHAMSCCPTETALTQKKSIAAAPMVFVHVDALALISVDAATVVFESARSSVPVVSQTGRDILRQVHVLRI
jgi:hypothetical protein